jgi:hypothetical protein
MKVGIHQPECFPWAGFFHKMSLCDTFVLLDTVQFEKNNFQNRNKILSNGLARWITIPVQKHSLDTCIKDIQIDWEHGRLTKKHLATIEQNYSKCDYFEIIYCFLVSLYEKKHVSLSDFTTEFILWMANVLEIRTNIVKASSMSLSGSASGGTEVTLEICKKLYADTYISGSGAREYLDVSAYSKEHMAVYFQDFHHPVYFQKNSQEFVSHLSSIDIYANHGKESLNIIQKGNVIKSDLL